MEEREKINSKISKKVKKIRQFLLNPKLIICILVAWLITNGWSYIFLFIGTYFKITWMIKVSTAYLAFLWLPITPEKIITITLAIGLLQLLFPNDKKTLSDLKSLHGKAKKNINEK